MLLLPREAAVVTVAGSWSLVVLFCVGGVLSLYGDKGRGLVWFDAADGPAVDSRRRGGRNVFLWLLLRGE